MYSSSSGYPDTERFKFLNSVSNQSRCCLEDDGEEFCAAIGLLLDQWFGEQKGKSFH
jgi:hypothetical protein